MEEENEQSIEEKEKKCSAQYTIHIKTCFWNM